MSRPQRARAAWALRLFSRADRSGTEQHEHEGKRPRPTDLACKFALASLLTPVQ